jgi:hypothetical protein
MTPLGQINHGNPLNQANQGSDNFGARSLEFKRVHNKRLNSGANAEPNQCHP